MKTITLFLYVTIILTTIQYGIMERTSENKCKDWIQLQACLAEVSLPANQTKGFPSSEQQVDRLCSFYKRRSYCVDLWAKDCLSNKQKSIFYGQRKGVMLLMKLLCNDPNFRNEYLNHTSCYVSVSEDWNRCLNTFQTAIREFVAFNETEKNENFLCCTKYGFNKCVTMASKAKCNRSAAIMLRRISETLTGDTIRNNKCEAMKGTLSCMNKGNQLNANRTFREILFITFLFVVLVNILTLTF